MHMQQSRKHMVDLKTAQCIQMPWPRSPILDQQIDQWLASHCQGTYAVLMHYVYFEMIQDAVEFKLTWY